MSEQAWFFYMVRCNDGSLYSGITNDVDARIRAHNNGTGAKYTCGKRPVILVYQEKYDNVSKARKRETQIKNWSKIKKERLIKGIYTQLEGDDC